MARLATLYRTDYAQWARRNAELLRAGRFEELDISVPRAIVRRIIASAWRWRVAA